MPSDADLMKIAIDDLNNFSISLEDRQRALQELLVLVEPIDNANGKSAFLFFSPSVCYLLLCRSTKLCLYPQKTETSNVSPLESRALGC